MVCFSRFKNHTSTSDFPGNAEKVISRALESFKVFKLGKLRKEGNKFCIDVAQWPGSYLEASKDYLPYIHSHKGPSACWLISKLNFLITDY